MAAPDRSRRERAQNLSRKRRARLIDGRGDFGGLAGIVQNSRPTRPAPGVAVREGLRVDPMPLAGPPVTVASAGLYSLGSSLGNAAGFWGAQHLLPCAACEESPSIPAERCGAVLGGFADAGNHGTDGHH